MKIDTDEIKKGVTEAWKSFQESPGPLVSFIGLILLSVGAIGGIHSLRIDVSTPIAFLRCVVIGAAFFVGGGIIWSLQSRKPGNEFRFLPWFLAAVGLLYSTLLFIAHFKKIKIFDYSPTESGFDELVLGLAFASLCGFLPAFVSASTLKRRSDEIAKQVGDLKTRETELITSLKTLSDGVLVDVPKKIDEQLQRVDQSQKDFLKELKKNAEEMVEDVKGSTRTMLEGFDEVFAMALSMISAAEEELTFVNFAMNFGSPHRYNDKIKQRYKGGTLEKDISLFRNKLAEKVKGLPDVRILTISDEFLVPNFLEPLSHRVGYEASIDKIEVECDRARSAKAAIRMAINEPDDMITHNPERRYLVEAERLPLQLLITKIRDENGSLRRKCLVLMVGTDMLKSGVSPGGEPAFSTELPDMIEVFDRLANALIIAAQQRKKELEDKRMEDARKLLSGIK